MPDPISGVPGQAEVAPEATPAGGGVAQATPTQQPGDGGEAPSGGQSAEHLQQELEQARTDLNRMKSSLQKQAAQQEAAQKAKIEALETELHSLKTKDMDEVERLRYEKEQLETRLGQFQTEVQRVQAAQAEQDAKSRWLQWASEGGLDVSKIDTSLPFYGGFYNQIMAQVSERLKGSGAPPQPKGVEPAPVASGTPGSVEAEGTIGQAIRTIMEREGYKSPEAVWRAIETSRPDLAKYLPS